MSDDIKRSRKNKNDDLIARMKAGESLALYNPQDTWFQPRPIIKKDQEKIDTLFGNEQTEKVDSKPKPKLKVIE